AHQRAEEDADETIEDVDRRERRFEPEAEIRDQFHERSLASESEPGAEQPERQAEPVDEDQHADQRETDGEPQRTEDSGAPAGEGTHEDGDHQGRYQAQALDGEAEDEQGGNE